MGNCHGHGRTRRCGGHCERGEVGSHLDHKFQHDTNRQQSLRTTLQPSACQAWRNSEFPAHRAGTPNAAHEFDVHPSRVWHQCKRHSGDFVQDTGSDAAEPAYYQAQQAVAGSAYFYANSYRTGPQCPPCHCQPSATQGLPSRNSARLPMAARHAGIRR